MGRLIKLISPAFIYFCVGTVIAQIVGLSYFLMNVKLTDDKLFQVIAAAHDINVHEMKAEAAAADKSAEEEQVSFEAIIEARLKKNLNLDLREQGLDQGLLVLRNLQDDLEALKEDLDIRTEGFDEKLSTLQKEAVEGGIAEVQRTIEVMNAQQAKVQLLMMLEGDDKDSVIRILKAMPVDKRKKIAAEFKTPEDAQQLQTILLEILRGEPEATLIDSARS